MNDEEVVQTQDPVTEFPSESESQPDPEPVTSPMEVVPVDELLDRISELLAEKDAALEDAEAEQPMETVDGAADVPISDPDPVTGLLEGVVDHLLDMIVDLGKIEEHTKEIQLDVMTMAQMLDHPALITSFSDYTVTEALLLFLLLAAFVSACARMLRGGFSWLRS